ncbi:hypothetical protein FHG87_006797, partial [Trinorchestia longiramus]
LTADNDDIERELYSLGLSDDNPLSQHPIVSGVFPVSPALSAVSGLSSLPTHAPRSHSAPAPLYPTQPIHSGFHNVFPIHDPSAVHYPGHVYPQDFLTLPRDPTPSTASYFLGQIPIAQQTIPHYPPLYPSRSPHYAREPFYPSPYSPYQHEAPPLIPPDPLPPSHQQLVVAKIEAALRRLQKELQESYLLLDTHGSPPPPQPSSPHLKDPPPSPVPPYDQYSPPGPSNRPAKGPPPHPGYYPYGGNYPGAQDSYPPGFQYPHGTSPLLGGRHRRHPPLRKHRSHPEQRQLDQIEVTAPIPQVQIQVWPQSPQQVPLVEGQQHPTTIVDQNNASHLSRRLGFKPIQYPEVTTAEDINGKTE